MNYKVLGSHQGIDLVELEDGTQLYYSPRTKKAGIGVTGLSRLLGCNPATVLNAGLKLHCFRELKMYTGQGIQGLNLILDDELPKILTLLSSGRVKRETREAAIALQEKLAQAGFRLMVMLRAAPEELANEIVDNHLTPEENARVSIRARGKAIRHLKTETLTRVGVNSTGIAICTNATYRGLFGKTARQLRAEYGIEGTPRDYMSGEDLTTVSFSELAESKKIAKEARRFRGSLSNREAEFYCLEVAKDVKRFLENI